MTTEQTLTANPWMTYGFACGFVSGRSAKKAHDQFAGLSAQDWQHASDDYAQGYRAGYKEAAH